MAQVFEQRMDLKQLSLADVNELQRRINRKPRWGKNLTFIKELQEILHTTTKDNIWERLKDEDVKEGEHVVLGDVWKQTIGEYYHKSVVHKYEYVYTDSKGVVIAPHTHEQSIHDDKQLMKMSQWYIYRDGRMEQCKKGKAHSLVNSSGKPMYVIVLTIISKKVH